LLSAVQFAVAKIILPIKIKPTPPISLNSTNIVIGAKKIPNTKKVPSSNNFGPGKYLHLSS